MTATPNRRSAWWLIAGVLVGASVTTGAAMATLSLTRGQAPTAAGAPRMIEETATSGINHVYDGEYDFYVGGGVAVFDCDSDRRPDMYIAGGSEPAGLYRNLSPTGGELIFSPVPSSATDLTRVTGAYPLDIDSDGLVDLAVLRHGANVLLRGLGDCEFEDAGDQWGLDGGQEWTTAFSAMWQSGAEFPTLVFGNYRRIAGDEYEGCADNFMHLPSGAGYGGTRTALSPGWCTLSTLFSDWGHNRQPDLRFTNDRHYYEDGEEQLWDMGSQTPRLYGREDGWQQIRIWGMGIASQDLTADGLPEIYLTSQGDNKLQTLAGDSDQPDYEDMALGAGATAHRPFTGDNTKPSTAWHSEFDDVNNDGLIDLFVSKGNVEAQVDFAAEDPNNLLLGQPDGTFVEGAEDSGFVDVDRSRGGALADLNMDGLLDIVVVERRTPVRLWRNTGPGQGAGHWLEIDLEQPTANRDAIGAWIEVRFGSTNITKEITVGGGHAGGQLGWTHFGLGEDASAEIRVTWPNGETGPWLGVEADQLLTVHRDQVEAEVFDPLQD